MNHQRLTTNNSSETWEGTINEASQSLEYNIFKED